MGHNHSDGALEDLSDFTTRPEGDGVLVISTTGRIMSFNLQLERLFRRIFSKGDKVRPKDLFSPPHLMKAETALKECFKKGDSRSDMLALIRLETGLPVPITYSIYPLSNDNGATIGAVFTFKDNEPDRNKPHHINLPGELEFDNLFENLAEGVFTIDRRWRITSFNPRAQEITGFKLEEVLNRFCWDIFKSDLCQTGCPLKSTVETGVIRMDQDVRIVGKHGRKMTILVNTSILKGPHNQVLGAIETFRPVLGTISLNRSPESLTAAPSDIVGNSKALITMLERLPDIANSGASVILEGESGTGKELFARAIHSLSPRAGGPFIAVNCSALSETLLESELFGHEKAAFTGAVNSKAGRFELARGGTLFLDEIAEIKPEIQVKLLRVLEERVFERVGGTRPIQMDARLITATNRTLADEVQAKRFRKDLYYRLRTVPIQLPPLRERTGDIPLLVNHFVAKLNKKYNKRVRGVDPKVMNFFCRYEWPGNIRELQHLLEHAFVFVKGPIISLSHLPETEKPAKPLRPAYSQERFSPGEDERMAILKAIERSNGSRTEAAKLLGISRSTLWRKMKGYDLV